MSVPPPTSQSLWATAAEPEPTAPNFFSVLSDEHDGQTVLHVYGDIDLSSGPALKDHLTAAQARRPRRLVLDLGGVTFMDSTGVALITEANARAAADGGQFALARPPRQAQRILTLAGVDRIVAVES